MTKLSTRPSPKTKKLKTSIDLSFNQTIPEKIKPLLKDIVFYLEDEILITDADANILFINEKTAQGLGYSQKYILKKKVIDFLQDKPSLAQWRQSVYIPIKETKGPLTYTVKRIRRNKKRESIRITAWYFNVKGEGYVVSIGRNVTTQAHLRRRLDEVQILHEKLSDQLAEGILTLDLKGVVIYINQAAAQITQNRRKDIIGTHFTKYIKDKNSLTRSKKFFQAVLNGKAVEREELFIQGNNHQNIPIEFTASPIIIDGEITQIHLIIRDMTKRKRLNELERDHEKMQAVQSLLIGTSHEIQDPLRSLRDKTDMLIQEYANRDFEYIGFREFENIFKTLHKMREQIQYCFDTSNRLIDINKARAGIQKSCSNVNLVVKHLSKLSTDQFKKNNIKLQMRLSSSVPQAAIDPLDLERIVNNVLQNAVQSIHGNGQIQLRTLYRSKEENVCFECRDNGVGIEKENLARIFEPFFTTKHRGVNKNSGLGLSVVYALIQKYHGHIQIKSTQREGTFVQICFPICKKRNKFHNHG